MIVNFYATLRQVVGRRQAEFEFEEGQTLRELVRSMIEKYPDLGPAMLDENGNLSDHIHIFVNGRDSTLLPDKLDSVLSPDDVISIFPPVGGGRQSA